MNNLVSAAAGSDFSPQQLLRAELLVAARLGLPSLAEAEHAEVGSVGSGGLIHLRRPAVSISALTLGGAPAAGILQAPHVLDVRALMQQFQYGSWGSFQSVAATPYNVRYVHGWKAGSLPPAIEVAVLMLTEQLAAASSHLGIRSESMGPVSVTYQDSALADGLGADIELLLRPWLPVRF